MSVNNAGIRSFAINMRKVAQDEGMVVGQPWPKRYTVLGPPEWHFIASVREAVVTDVDPGCPRGPDTLLWVNPVTLEVRKSSNAVNPTNPTWILLGATSQAFSDSDPVTSAHVG